MDGRSLCVTLYLLYGPLCNDTYGYTEGHGGITNFLHNSYGHNYISIDHHDVFPRNGTVVPLRAVYYEEHKTLPGY